MLWNLKWKVIMDKNIVEVIKKRNKRQGVCAGRLVWSIRSEGHKSFRCFTDN